MAKRRIEVDIVANDKASGIFAKVRHNANGMSSSLTTMLSGTVNAVGNFDLALRRYNSSMHNFNRVVGNVVRSAGDSIYNFTKDAINNFSELERQHAKTMGAMATEYGKTTEAQSKFLSDSEKLKQQAIRIGTFGVNNKGALNTISEVSSAQTSLVKSGLSADDLINSDVVESILKFAGGNDLDVDTATQFAVNLGTVFDKPVEQWSSMLDMVTKAADISVIDVEDIMDSLTYTGGIASGLGRDLEEVLGIISVMGQAGLRGRVAGTGLQAFFTRILSAGDLSDAVAGSAPSEYVAQIYDAFTSEAVNTDGSFKDMDDVAVLLDTAMESLNDQEQAWFAKKLFGLYQMKAAYALTGAVDGDTNLITDFINQITNQSSGTNDIKYELMQGSQYGKITALQNAWEGIKTDVGDRLSPVVSTVADELLRFLSDPENYDINWNNLYDAISESGDLIGEKYGQELGQAIEDIGNFGIDATQIAGALAPQVGGIIGGIGKLLQGDIFGALEEFSDGLEETNDNIEDLPPELQDTAEAARNVITAFTTLAGLNLSTQILQIITSAFNMFIAKPIKWMLGKVTSTNTTISSPSTNINATFINIGSVQLMNVNANVVNIYGMGGNRTNPNNPNSPATPSLPVPVPTSPSSPTIIPTLPPSPTTPALPSGPTITPQAGPSYTLYKFGGKWMTAGQIMKTIGTAAFRGVGALGTTALVLSLGGSSPNPTNVFGRNLQTGMDSGLSGDELRQYVMDNQYGASTHINGSQAEKDTYEREYASKMYDAMLEHGGYFGSQEGLTDVLNKLVEHYEDGGSFNEDYFSDLFSFTASNGVKIDGTQELATEVLNALFGETFKPGWLYGGSFNDNKMEDFIKSQIEGGLFGDLSSLPSIFDGYESSEIHSTADINDVVNGVNEAIDRIQSPNITVNVTTNVDRNGNPTSIVNIDSVSRGIARRASQYGQTHMIN